MTEKTDNLKDYWKNFNKSVPQPQTLCLELCEPTCLSIEWLEVHLTNCPQEATMPAIKKTSRRIHWQQR